MRKYWYRRFLLVLLVLSILGYAGYEITKRQEQGRKKEVSADNGFFGHCDPGRNAGWTIWRRKVSWS